MTKRRWGNDDAMVAGVDGLLIGVVIVVTGTLLFANLWGVLAARMAANEAAAAAARAYVEAPDGASASDAARRVAAEAMEAHQRQLSAIALRGERWERCTRVIITVETVIPRFALPGLGGAGQFTVSATHSELVDPYRSAEGLPGEVNCAG